MVRLTESEGSVVRPNLAEPPSSADTDADADSSVVHRAKFSSSHSRLEAFPFLGVLPTLYCLLLL